MSSQEREIAPVGADVDESHSRLQDGLNDRRLLRLVASGETNFSRNRIAQVANELKSSQAPGHAHRKRRRLLSAKNSAKALHGPIPAGRQAADQACAQANP